VYLNLVEGRLWVPAVAGSNPATPTQFLEFLGENRWLWTQKQQPFPRYYQLRDALALRDVELTRSS
jgi:hypothetical protein